MAAVLVHIDLDGERPHPSSLAALAAGRHVASSWGATLYAAVIAHEAAAAAAAQIAATKKLPGIEAVQTQLARCGADKVVIALTDAPIAPLWSAIGTAWQAVLDHLRPRLVLFGADSPSAAELGPRTGARIGARLLNRARSLGVDDVELRDRDGGYVRVDDSGAAVVLVGQAPPTGLGEDDIDLEVLVTIGGADSRIEVVGSAPAELSQTCGAVVALGDDVLDDEAVVADARRLADQLGATLVGGPAAVQAGVVDPGAIVDRWTPLAPELCVVIGTAHLDLSGATSIVRIGTAVGKSIDGALPAPVGDNLAALVKRLDEPPPRVRAQSEPTAGGTKR